MDIIAASEMTERIRELELKLNSAEEVIRAQAEQISCTLCSLQAIFALLVDKDYINLEVDGDRYQKVYTASLAKMDQAQAVVLGRLT